MGETARPQRAGPTIEPRPPTARTREGGQLYSYDGNGNLTARDTQGLAYDTGNRLKQLGDVVFERDGNGQLIRQTSPERDDRYDWRSRRASTSTRSRRFEPEALAALLSAGMRAYL